MKEWQKEENEKLKNTQFKIYNKYSHRFFVVWFWFTIVIGIISIIFILVILKPYIPKLIELFKLLKDIDINSLKK